MDELIDIIEDLKQRAIAHRNEAASHVAAADRLDDAVAALEGVPTRIPAQRVTVHVDASPPPKPPAEGEQPSVMQMILALLAEEPRSWTADQIVSEYQRRGTPLAVADPSAAVFSSLSRGAKKGWLARVGKGRYTVPKHASAVRQASMLDGGEVVTEQHDVDELMDQEEFAAG